MTNAPDSLLVTGPNFEQSDIDSILVTPTGGVQQTLADALIAGWTINVKSFGATGDGLTDDTLAIQRAINYALQTNSKVVYFPAGVYFSRSSSPSLSVNVPSGSGLTLRGDGLDSSILYWQCGAGGADTHHLFWNANATSPTYGDLTFQGLQFKGNLGAGGTVNAGGAALFLNAFNSIRLLDCKFYNTCSFATTCEFIQYVQVEGCVFENCMRDMCRFRSSFNVIVNGNTFRHGGDDAVALHANYTLTQASQIREGLVVTNNIFEDTCGISILGGRMVHVANNIMRRVKLHGIYVAPDSLEGSNPIFGITITDNELYDTLPRPPYTTANQLAIAVNLHAPAAGTLPVTTNGNLPGEYDATTGAFIPWYTYRNVNYQVANNAFPNAYGIRISGNRIQRTLPAVANYSLWGYGQVVDLTSPTGFSDPAVTDALMRPFEAIGVTTFGIGWSICDNMIWTAAEAIEVTSNMVSNNSYSFLISRNQFYDISSAAIRFHGSVEDTADGIISDNVFDLDPYYLSANRTQPLDGTWNNTTDIQPAVIYTLGGAIDGLQFHRNTIKNAMCVFQTIVFDAKDNVLVCQPAGPGTNTANAGIQKLPTIGPAFRLQVRDCNPTSGTFGQLLNYCLVQSSAMPSSGYYLQGHFVQATGNPGVLGWYRLTSGSAHVLGTDWLPVSVSGVGVGATTVQVSAASSVAGAGSDQPSATLLAANINLVTSGPVGGGVRLPNLVGSGTSGTLSTIIWVYNSTANPLNVYPQTGGGFRGLAAGVAVSLAAGASGAFAVAGSGQWLQLK